MSHPLLDPVITAAVERAATAHRGTRWTSSGFTDLGDRAAHPCGIFRGAPFSVFAKLASASASAPGGRSQFAAELAGLDLISRLSPVATPIPVATGIIEVPAPGNGGGGRLILLAEALPERTTDRTPDDYRGIGRALATLHGVHHPQFGLAGFDGFFGPFPQDNRPVPANSWPEFYAERRVRPLLKDAADSGQLPVELTLGVERVLDRLPRLAGPEVRPSLLHGDAQQNNFLCTPGGVVVIDACPYFGHPEIDLALVDYFEPVPAELFAGYREIRPVDAGFAERRELWRIFAYLGVLSADGQNPLGRQHLRQLADAVGRYG